MLYFFYGDSQKAGEKAKDLANSLLGKKPDASLFVINDENCNEETLQEMTQSSALFENKYIVRVKPVLQGTDILKFLKEMKESENIFIWSEGEVNKSDLKKIEKYAEKVVELARSKKQEARSNKIFDICTPIINRDKKKLWTKYQELLETYSAEELHGTIFWQFKNIAIVQKATQKESGLAPFPYSQAQKATNKYTEREVLGKTAELVSIVHESRMGGAELPIALEKFILNI